MPAPLRQLVVIAIIAAAVGAAITTSFEYANHKPTPHDVRLQVVAPPTAQRSVRVALATAEPGGFSVRPGHSLASVTAALRRQQADGGLVLGPGKATIVTAGALGPSLQNLLIKGLTELAAHQHLAVSQVDAVPLRPADRSDTSCFTLLLGLLIPSVVGSIGLYLVGRRSRLWWRFAAAVLYAVLIGLFGALIVHSGFHALGGSLPALWGIGTFGALAFIMFVGALQTLFGLPGTGLGAVVLVFLGNAVTGGTTPAPLLPDVYRQISPWIPNGAALRGIRSVVYFHGHGLGQPLISLEIWVAALTIALCLCDLVHQNALRAARAEGEGDVETAPIYVASTVSLLRGRR